MRVPDGGCAFMAPPEAKPTLVATIARWWMSRHDVARNRTTAWQRRLPGMRVPAGGCAFMAPPEAKPTLVATIARWWMNWYDVARIQSTAWQRWLPEERDQMVDELV
jgi:hypothetical protein